MKIGNRGEPGVYVNRPTPKLVWALDKRIFTLVSEQRLAFLHRDIQIFRLWLACSLPKTIHIKLKFKIRSLNQIFERILHWNNPGESVRSGSAYWFYSRFFLRSALLVFERLQKLYLKISRNFCNWILESLCFKMIRKKYISIWL